MTKKFGKFSFVALLASALCSCFPPQYGTELRYRLSIDYLFAAKSLTSSSVNAVSIRRRYLGLPGANGLVRWQTRCRLQGYAIPIPVDDGKIFALLDNGPGGDASEYQCSLVTSGFDSQTWPDDNKSWVKTWNALARSSKSAIVNEFRYPQFFFVPNNAAISNGTLLSADDLKNRGVRIKKISISITDEQVSPMPASVKALGCQVSVGTKSQGSGYPTCTSTVSHDELDSR